MFWYFLLTGITFAFLGAAMDWRGKHAWVFRFWLVGLMFWSLLMLAPYIRAGAGVPNFGPEVADAPQD